MNSFRVFEYGTPAKGIVFIFGGWRTIPLFYKFGIKHMNKAGLKCILMIPRTNLIGIGTPYKVIIDAYSEAEMITERAIIGATKDMLVLSMGISLGTVYALKIAKQYKRVDRLILLAPFGDFEYHVHAWANHHYFGRVLKSQSLPIDDSIKVLQELDPLKDLDLLEGKDILIGYGLHDKMIHTAASQKLVCAMKKQKLTVHTKISRAGHYGGIYLSHVWLIRKQSRYLSK